MSILKKKEGKVDPDLYTKKSDIKMQMCYEARVDNNCRVKLRLIRERWSYEEYVDTPLLTLGEIPLRIFEDAIKEWLYHRTFWPPNDVFAPYYNPHDWKLVLVRADEEIKRPDAAVLFAFEAAVMERERVDTSIRALYPYGENVPEAVKTRQKEVHEKVEEYKKRLLKVYTGLSTVAWDGQYNCGPTEAILKPVRECRRYIPKRSGQTSLEAF